MTSPTQRSLAHARKQGWRAGVVERWNPHARIRQDLFGCIDLIVVESAVTPEQRSMGQRPAIVGVQACSGTDHAKRVAKVADAPILGPWIAAGGRVEVWSWTKRGARGKRKLWALRVEVVTPSETIDELAARINALPRRAPAKIELVDGVPHFLGIPLKATTP